MPSLYSERKNPGICILPRGWAALWVFLSLSTAVLVFDFGLLSLLCHFDWLISSCIVNTRLCCTSPDYLPQLILGLHTRCLHVLSSFTSKLTRNTLIKQQVTSVSACPTCDESLTHIVCRFSRAKKTWWLHTWLKAAFKPSMQPLQPPFPIKPTKSNIRQDGAPWESCHHQSSSKADLIEQNHRSQVGQSHLVEKLAVTRGHSICHGTWSQTGAKDFDRLGKKTFFFVQSQTKSQNHKVIDKLLRSANRPKGQKQSKAS